MKSKDCSTHDDVHTFNTSIINIYLNDHTWNGYLRYLLTMYIQYMHHFLNNQLLIKANSNKIPKHVQNFQPKLFDHVGSLDR